MDLRYSLAKLEAASPKAQQRRLGSAANPGTEGPRVVQPRRGSIRERRSCCRRDRVGITPLRYGESVSGRRETWQTHTPSPRGAAISAGIAKLRRRGSRDPAIDSQSFE